MRKQFWQNLIVGIFVLAVLGWGAYTIYQTSAESTMLLSKISLHTYMKNANGIQYYSPVRIHGIKIGKVESVRFSEKPGEDLILLDMSINSDYVGRIAIGNPDPDAAVADPEGAFAYFHINSEGLLGDNYLDIYAGDPTRAAEAARKSVRSWAAREIRKEWDDAGKTWQGDTVQPEIEARYQKLIKTVKNLDTGCLSDGMYLPTKPGGGGLAAITDSLTPTLARVNDLLDAAKTQPGLVHTLIYDPKGKELMANLNKTADNVQGLLGDIRQGPGGLHEVIYGDQVKRVLNDVTNMTGTVKKALVDVKGVTGDVQAVLADVKQKDLVGNIKGTLANVEDITRKINEGEGTVGMLINDKSLHQDLQELLGGAKRSTVIKEAVRYVKSKNREEMEAQPK
ncbi:MAG TPA: MlaD family protein [bacterium]|nr:MlaD family protein [bacterium]